MIVYLNSFEVNTNTNNFWLDEDITGLALPDIRTSSGQFSGQDGGYVGAQFFGMRQISLQGRCFSGDLVGLEQKRRAIQAVLLNKSITLRIITNAGNDYTIDCNVTKFDMPIKRELVTAPFKLELLAPDPIIYDNTSGGLLTANVPRATGGGYTFPVVYPVIWAAGTQPTTVTNSGTAAVWPTITIAGTATNPMIANLTTGKFFKVNNLTLGSGDTLVIDMKNKTVLLNGGSVFYKVTDDSKWLELQVGDNLLQYTTDSSGDAAIAVVTWRSGYIGI